jgi:hypothetical protein
MLCTYIVSVGLRAGRACRTLRATADQRGVVQTVGREMQHCHRRWSTAALWAVLAVCGAIGPRDAWAWCRTTTCQGAACSLDRNGCPAQGVAVAWRGGCIGYSVEAAGARLIPVAQLQQAVRRAFQTWSQVDCGGGQYASITFAELAPTLCSGSGFAADGPNANVVAFQDDDWKFKEDNNVAKTSVHFDTASGEVLDADLEINTAVNLFTTDDAVAASDPKYLDLQTVVTHEVGHMLGLAHSDHPDAVMHAQYKQGSLAGRTLSADDIAAVCAAYPPGRVATCDPIPRGGLDSCAHSPEDTWACQATRHAQGGAGGAVVVAMAGLAWAVARAVCQRSGAAKGRR